MTKYSLQMQTGEMTALQILQSLGYQKPTLLATGMEGTVFELEPKSTIAKVWFSKTRLEVLALNEAYASAKKSRNRDIELPLILDLQEVAGHVVTIERFLKGSMLESNIFDSNAQVNIQAIEALSSCLSMLRSHHDAIEFGRLPLLGMWTDPIVDGNSLVAAIKSLISQKCEKTYFNLQRDLSGLRELIECTFDFLDTRRHCKCGIVHGDLFGANILVNDKLIPTAIVDFGFLSTYGDPAFDVAISGSIYSMYHKNALQIDNYVTGMLARRLDHALPVLLAYKAIYALLTAGAYSQSREDGHYQWCINLLNRADIRASLGL